MINRNFLYVLVTLGLFLVTSSCSSSDDATIIDNSVRINEIKSAILSGTWRITSFIDSGNNETSDFTGYNFTFNENGTLTASNGTDTIDGTWSVIEDDDSNDDSNYDDDIDFNISFLAPPSFTDLTDDWDVTSSSTTKIELIDISGGNGGTDTLTFERN